MSSTSLISATLAGVIASFTESTVTYPLEYIKTRHQLAVRPTALVAAKQIPGFSIPNLTSVIYQGWTPFVVGNALKTWVRFNAFNAATKFLSTNSHDGKSDRATAPVVILSGVLTGVAETLVVVPFESIKTTMIEASSVGKGIGLGALPPLGAPNTRLAGKSQILTPKLEEAHPSSVSKPVSSVSSSAGPVQTQAKTIKPAGTLPIRPVRPPPAVSASSSASASLDGVRLVPVKTPQGMLRTVRDMFRDRGLRAFVQGFNPTVMRQVANSAVRFTAWNTWMQMVALDGEDHMSWYNVVFGSGVVAAVEALATQPLDVVKTRMQTANGLKLYGNSLVCAYKVFTEEGWHKLWSGLAPRFVRKWVSAGIIWAVYEVSMKEIDQKMRELPFN